MSVWMTCPTCSSRLICLESSVMRASVPGSIRPALLAAGHRCGCATGGAQMPTGATVHASPHSTSARRHRPPSRVMCSSPSVQEVPVPGAAQLRPPPLRREIDVVEPEAVGVALGPLEVIEQSPGEISPDRDAARDRLTQRRHVTALREAIRSEEHTSELQSRRDLVCRLLLEKKKKKTKSKNHLDLRNKILIFNVYRIA